VTPARTQKSPKKSAAKSPLLLLTNITQLVTVAGNGQPRRGKHLSDISLVRDGAVLCQDGEILAAGKQLDIMRHPALKRARGSVKEIDCTGRTVIPGFVDSHTHPAFMWPRLVDFEKRIGGADYEEIAKAGGGIRSSILPVRKATRGELADRVLSAFREMAAHGTTTVEAKSGYGLDCASEIKSLEAIRAAAEKWPGTVRSTLLGAHVVPKEYALRRKEYVMEVCGRMIPTAAGRELAEFVDVFCEQGAFTLEEALQIFAAAEASGLVPRAHIGQFTQCPLSRLLEHDPASLDHLDHVADEDIALLAKQNTVATLVPGAAYFLGEKQYPDARRMISAGVAVALATDFNPGTSPSASMPFILNLACTHMQMSPAEVLVAATTNGAHALRLADRKGSIEPGKDADLAVFDCRDYREIAYWFGADKCSMTIAGGRVLRP
jgi:imidazolonepropionase